DEADREEPTAPRAAVVGDVAVVGANARHGELGIDYGLEAEDHRAVQHLRVDPLAIHVRDADAVEDAADRGLRMDRGEGALARPVGLREDALELGAARAGIEIADDEAWLAVPVGARRQAGAIRRV